MNVVDEPREYDIRFIYGLHPIVLDNTILVQLALDKDTSNEGDSSPDTPKDPGDPLEV